MKGLFSFKIKIQTDNDMGMLKVCRCILSSNFLGNFVTKNLTTERYIFQLFLSNWKINEMIGGIDGPILKIIKI